MITTVIVLHERERCHLLLRDLGVLAVTLSKPLLFLLLLLLHHLNPPLLQSLKVILVHSLQLSHLRVHLVFHDLVEGHDNFPSRLFSSTIKYLSSLHELLAKNGPHLIHLTSHLQILPLLLKKDREFSTQEFQLQIPAGFNTEVVGKLIRYSRSEARCQNT